MLSADAPRCLVERRRVQAPFLPRVHAPNAFRDAAPDVRVVPVACGRPRGAARRRPHGRERRHARARRRGRAHELPDVQGHAQTAAVDGADEPHGHVHLAVRKHGHGQDPSGERGFFVYDNPREFVGYNLECGMLLDDYDPADIPMDELLSIISGDARYVDPGRGAERLPLLAEFVYVTSLLPPERYFAEGSPALALLTTVTNL